MKHPRYRPGDLNLSVFTRRVMLTTLDPIPRPFRACPGWIVMNRDELDAFNKGDRDMVALMIDICNAEDAAEARGIYKYSTKGKIHGKRSLETGSRITRGCVS